MHARTAAALGLAIALVTAACGGSARGDESPPASLDPSSPTISALGVEFDRDGLEVPANDAFILVFENREAIDHNVAIYADSSLQDRRFEGVIFRGPATHWYQVPALAPGTYFFRCDLHPSMDGELVAA
jgi:plastocyanin